MDTEVGTAVLLPDRIPDPYRWRKFSKNLLFDPGSEIRTRTFPNLIRPKSFFTSPLPRGGSAEELTWRSQVGKKLSKVRHIHEFPRRSSWFAAVEPAACTRTSATPCLTTTRLVKIRHVMHPRLGRASRVASGHSWRGRHPSGGWKKIALKM